LENLAKRITYNPGSSSIDAGGGWTQMKGECSQAPAHLTHLKSRLSTVER